MAAKKQKTSSTKQAKSVLARQDDGTIQLTITIPYNLVKEKREEALSHMLESLEIPGFRKGKAPKDVALKHIEQQQLSNHTLQHLLPEVYAQAVEEHKIKPILAPRFELQQIEEGEDWVVRAVTCELPQVDIKDYKKEITGLARADDIWVPGKDKDKKEPAKEEKEQKVIQKLLEIAEVNLPGILIEEEVNHRLSGLMDQLQKLGLTVEQYLSSTGKSIDQIRREYAARAQQAIKLELALNKVAQEEGVKVDEKEIEEVIESTGDPKTKEALSNPQQKGLIKSTLVRRKALDRLVGLI